MSTSDILGIVGLVLGVLSILVGGLISYYFYRKGIQKKEPYWSLRTYNLIEDYTSGLPNLKVLYRDEKIENLSSSRLWIWNRGKLTIDKHDIQTINPLRVVVSKPTKILDIVKTRESNPSNHATAEVSADGTSAQITFDYLDEGHGAVFQIIHTGTSSNDIKLVGDIKGAQFQELDEEGTARFALIATFGSMGLALLFAVPSVYLAVGLLPIAQTNPWGVIIVILAMLPWAVFGGMLPRRLEQWSKKGPQGLGFYIEEDPVWQEARRWWRKPKVTK